LFGGGKGALYVFFVNGGRGADNRNGATVLNRVDPFAGDTDIGPRYFKAGRAFGFANALSNGLNYLGQVYYGAAAQTCTGALANAENFYLVVLDFTYET
jgi:hypothetical protein